MTDSPNMDEIRSMTPQQATDALAAMGTASNPAPPIAPPMQPANAQDARAQRDLLSRDPSVAAAFFAGDRAVRDQFDKLNEIIAGGDVVADALAGVVEPRQIIETTTSGQFPARDVKAVIDDMRMYNISDGAIKEGIEGTPISAQEHALAAAFKAMKFGDAEWYKRLMAKDWVATRELKLMCNILSRPIIAEPK